MCDLKRFALRRSSSALIVHSRHGLDPKAKLEAHHHNHPAAGRHREVSYLADAGGRHAPADQTAIKSYLKDNAPRDTLNEVMGSLAALDRVERWIYSPRAGKLKRGISPLPRTFDTSRTPEPGEDPIEPKMLGELDLGEIAAALAPKKADDERIEAMLTPPSEADQVARVAALLERDEQIAELTAKRDELIGRLADAEIKIFELQNILGKVREAVGEVAQKDEDRSCATCSLCWNSERTISFLEH